MNSYSISSNFAKAFWAARISNKSFLHKKKALRHSQSLCSVFVRLSPSSDEVYGKPFRGWQNTASEHNTPLSPNRHSSCLPPWMARTYCIYYTISPCKKSSTTIHWTRWRERLKHHISEDWHVFALSFFCFVTKKTLKTTIRTCKNRLYENRRTNFDRLMCTNNDWHYWARLSSRLSCIPFII